MTTEIHLHRRPGVGLLDVHAEFDPDGTKHVFVDSWPQRLLVDDYFLAGADPSLVRQEGNLLYFTPENGSAVYRFVRHDAGSPISEWEGLE